MGIILSRRVGSEPYYLSYEKAFDKISSKEAQIKIRRSKRRKWLDSYSGWGRFGSLAWGLGSAVLWGWLQRTGDVTKILGRYYWTAVAMSIAIPALLFSLATLLLKVREVMDNRDATYLKKLAESRKKMLKELKDSTHFDKTMALLKKYDPESQPPARPPQLPAGGTSNMKTGNNTPASQLLMMSGTMAAAAAAGAGKALLPMFDTLANNMIGDNPQLLEELRRAREEADKLRQENTALKQHLAGLTGRQLQGPTIQLLPPPESYQPPSVTIEELQPPEPSSDIAAGSQQGNLGTTEETQEDSGLGRASKPDSFDLISHSEIETAGDEDTSAGNAESSVPTSKNKSAGSSKQSKKGG